MNMRSLLLIVIGLTTSQCHAFTLLPSLPSTAFKASPRGSIQHQLRSHPPSTTRPSSSIHPHSIKNDGRIPSIASLSALSPTVSSFSFGRSPSVIMLEERLVVSSHVFTIPNKLTQLLQDVGGTVTVAAASGVWLKIWTSLASAGKVNSKDSRKIIHCGSGPLFLLCWPFFSADPTARFFAACVPLLQAIAVSIAGLTKPKQGTGGGEEGVGNKKPGGLVAAISRSGNPAEVLRGPLIYVIVLLLTTLLFWRDSVVGILAVSQMAAGDGMADIIGRRVGGTKWPFSETKSFAGTSAFAVAGFLVSSGLIAWFHFWGLIALGPIDALSRVAAISISCALIELVPLGDDNVTVPLSASVLAMLFFRS